MGQTGASFSGVEARPEGKCSEGRTRGGESPAEQGLCQAGSRGAAEVLQLESSRGAVAGEQQRCCSWQSPASLPASSHHAPRQPHYSLEAVPAQFLRLLHLQSKEQSCEPIYFFRSPIQFSSHRSIRQAVHCNNVPLK